MAEATPTDPLRESTWEAAGVVDTEPVESTLVVGRDVSLTLGTDSLIVLDEAILPEARPRLPCWGFFSHHPSTPATRSIPFYNVLWASLHEHDLTINYAHPISSTTVRPKCIAYPIVKSSRSNAARWIERLLEKAYGSSQRAKRIKLLINPFGGSGKAQKRFTRDIEPLFAAANCEVDVERTRFCGHAVEITKELDIHRYDVVASCSGDGLPHEVFNGLALRPDAGKALASVAVVQLPCGTGNAMSLNLNGTDSPSLAALAVVKGLKTPLDLVSVSQGEKRIISFLTQAFGIVAETDLGTEHLRWMGDFRFTYGILVRLLGKTTYPCDIALKTAVDTKPAIRQRCRDYREANIKPRSPEPTPTTTATASTKSTLSTAEDSLLPEPHDSTTLHPREALQNQPSKTPLASTLTPTPTPPLTTSTTPNTSQTGLPALLDGSALTPLPTNSTHTSTWGPLIPYPTIGNFYAGNMPWVARDMNFFPAALPADGCLDLICIDGTISRTDAIRTLLGIGSGKVFDMPWVEYRKVEGYRIVPRPRGTKQEGETGREGEGGGWGPGHGWGIGWDVRRTVNVLRRWLGLKPMLKRASSSAKGGGARQNGYVAFDGESFPYEAFQVEVHRGLGTVLSRSGKMYEAPLCE